MAILTYFCYIYLRVTALSLCKARNHIAYFNYGITVVTKVVGIDP